MGYKVKLNVFEGPFDLLVYLIENAQMNIYDIQVAQITAQYLNYIEKMKELDVNVATEFMVLASSLIEIKSKMLLPRVGMDGENIIEDDPRTELVERILEYKRFKQAAEHLEEREEQSLRIFEKPQEDLSKYIDAPDEYLSLDIKQFVGAFNLFLQKKKKLEYIRKNYSNLQRQKQTMESKISFIRDFFKLKKKNTTTFDELLGEEKNRYNKIVTFVALLEMVKNRTIKLKQTVLFGDIYISPQEKETSANDQ